MKPYSPLLVILIELLFQNQTLALALSDEISAYSKGNYPQAIAISHQLAIQDPNESYCHYYAGNSYSRLGEIPEAMREYSVCLNLSNDPQLRNYCDQALLYLIKNPLPNENQPTSRLLTNSGMRVIHHKGSETTYVPTDDLPTQDLQSIGKVTYKRFDSPLLTNQPQIYNVSGPTPIQTLNGINILSLNNQNSKQVPNNIFSPQIAQYNAIPGYMKPMPYPNQSYINSLFNASPLPPPPFPTSAKKAAEKALNTKIN